MNCLHHLTWSIVTGLSAFAIACSSLPPGKPAPATCQSTIQITNLAEALQPALFAAGQSAAIPGDVEVRSVVQTSKSTIHHVQLASSGDKFPINLATWSDPTSGKLIAIQELELGLICRGGPLPTVDDDVIVCYNHGCWRIGATGPKWKSTTKSLGGHSAIDSLIIFNKRAIGPAVTFIDIEQANGKVEVDRNPMTVFGLDVDNGTLVESWPHPQIPGSYDIGIKKVIQLDTDSVLALGDVVLDVIRPLNTVFLPFLGVLHDGGEWSSIHVFLDAAVKDLDVLHALAKVPTTGYLALFSTKAFEVDAISTNWRRQNYVLRLDKDWKVIGKTKLPGIMPGDESPTNRCVTTLDMTNARLEALADGRFVVLRTTVTPIGLAAKGTPFPKGGIIGEGFFFDSLGNHLSTFELPPHHIADYWAFDLNGNEPQLLSSSNCGLTVLWDSSTYALSPWGHKTTEEAGLCATLAYSDCADSNPCTNDLCDAKLGCTHPNLPDDAACSAAGVCKAGACVEP